MIYCSVKDGDLDLYVMDLKTKKEIRVTNTLGYDGGAWFSPDGKKLFGEQAVLQQLQKWKNIRPY